MLWESFHLRPRHALRGHRHQRIHVCVVLAGGFVERVGTGWTTCEPGTVRVSPGGTSHDLEADGVGAHVEIVELSALLESGLGRSLERSVYLDRSLTQELLDRLIAARREDDSFASECVALELVARGVVPSPRPAPPGWLNELRLGLDNANGGAHSLATLARRHDRHRSHVARAFRDWYGRSIGGHLRAWKLAEAARRLRVGDQSIADLACELGFTDQAHFTRAFRARYGVPPARFRQERGF